MTCFKTKLNKFTDGRTIITKNQFLLDTTRTKEDFFSFYISIHNHTRILLLLNIIWFSFFPFKA